jgi:hypothetical protein
MRGEVLACAEQHLGDVPASDQPIQEALPLPAKKRKPGAQKGGHLSPAQTEDNAHQRHTVS